MILVCLCRRRLMIRHTYIPKMKKKVIVLNKQLEKERVGKRRKKEKSSNVKQTHSLVTMFHTLMYSFSISTEIKIEIIVECARNTLTAVENLVRSISWLDALRD